MTHKIGCGQVINLFHLLVIVPLLVYVGIYKGAAPNWAFYALLFLAAVAALWHAYRLLQWWKKY